MGRVGEHFWEFRFLCKPAQSPQVLRTYNSPSPHPLIPPSPPPLTSKTIPQIDGLASRLRKYA